MKEIDKEVKEVYEKIAIAYDEALWSDMPYNDEIDKFCDYLNGKNVLDMGCAMGSFTKYVADKGFIVDGIDFCSNFINIAKRKVKNVNFYVMDMLDLKLDKLYDGVMLINSMIHIEKKHMVELFKNIKSILNEDGIVFVILQEGDGEQYVTEPLDESLTEFVNFYQIEEIEEVFKQSGFKIIETKKIIDENYFELGNNQLVYYLKK